MHTLHLIGRRIVIKTVYPVYLGETDIIGEDGWQRFVERVGKDHLNDVGRPDLSGGAPQLEIMIRPGTLFEPVSLISANFVLIHKDKWKTKDTLIREFTALADNQPAILLDAVIPGFSNLANYKTTISCADGKAEAYKDSATAVHNDRNTYAVIFPCAFDVAGREFSFIAYLITTKPLDKKPGTLVLGLTKEFQWEEGEETLRKLRNMVRIK